MSNKFSLSRVYQTPPLPHNLYFIILLDLAEEGVNKQKETKPKRKQHLQQPRQAKCNLCVMVDNGMGVGWGQQQAMSTQTTRASHIPQPPQSTELRPCAPGTRVAQAGAWPPMAQTGARAQVPNSP